MGEPERFDGENYPVEHFLLKLLLFFKLSSRFPTDYEKSLYLLSCLNGAALEWAIPLFEYDNPILRDYTKLTQALLKNFENPNKRENAMNQLCSLRQRIDSVRSYAIKFNQLAKFVSWNESALVYYFRSGLNTSIKDMLIAKDSPEHLSDMIILATRVEARLKEREEEKDLENSSASTPISQSNPQIRTFEPKNGGKDASPGNLHEVWANLPEKQRRYFSRLALKQCLYRGSSEHQIGNCPNKPSKEEGKEKAQSFRTYRVSPS